MGNLMPIKKVSFSHKWLLLVCIADPDTELAFAALAISTSMAHMRPLWTCQEYIFY